MDMINRYIYAVTKRLPEKQRDDIEKELRTLIDDMLEKYEGEEAYETKVQKVLLDLGDPEILANNYRAAKRYLIGPQNFENYMLILKIVMGAVFLGISISSAITGILAAEKNLIDIVASYIGILFSALLQAFAWVTIAFAIAEHNGVKVNDHIQMKDPWNPTQLPPVPDKKAAISPWEPMLSILFSAVFMAIFLFAPELFSAYISNKAGDIAVIPVFNLRVLDAYRIIFIAIFLLSVLKDVLKLVYGRWTMKLSAAVALLSLIYTVLMVMIFANSNIWNPSFASEISSHINLSIDFSTVWVKLTGAFLIIIVAACIVDIVSSLYKGVKYNISK